MFGKFVLVVFVILSLSGASCNLSGESGTPGTPGTPGKSGVPGAPGKPGGWKEGNLVIIGNDKMGKKTVSVGNYDSLLLEANFKVVLVEGKNNNILLEGETNIIEHIKTVLDNGKLVIAYPDNVWIKEIRRGITLKVPVGDIKSIENKSSGDIKGSVKIIRNKIDLRSAGSGSITLDLQVQDVVLNTEGSGGITLSGTTDKLVANLKGSGEINAIKLKSKVVQADLEGSGDIYVWATQKITANLSGSGDISFKGNPPLVEEFKTGSGDIKKLAD